MTDFRCMALKIDAKKNIRNKIRWGIAGVFALLLITASYDVPAFFNSKINWINSKTSIGLPNIPETNFALGLDLQGGAHLIYQADVSDIKEDERGDSVEGVRDVIERRVNGLGVGEPNIQTTKVGEDYRIIVELPGVTDVDEAIKMIGGTPILEFKELNKEPVRELTAEEQTELDNYNKEASDKALKVIEEINKGLDFAEAAKQYSENEASKNNGGYIGFVNEYSYYAPLFDWLESAQEGEMSKGAIESADSYNILKRGGSREGEARVRASHILICYLGATGCNEPIYTKEEAQAKAQELFNTANAENFAELAIANSSDLANAANGGDLEFFAKNEMVEPFANAVYDAQVGQIIGPVETEFGYHIIYKTEEEKPMEYEFSAIVINKMTPQDVLPPQEQFVYTGLTGSQLDRAEVVSDSQTGQIQVSLQFDSEGKELFERITTANVGQPVAIYLDGELISAPTVQQPILDGRAVITGNFDLNEARLLSQRLNAGALPVPVDLISQQTVGASLGAESLSQSLKAGIIALALVMIFMILYYRLPGLLSVIALLSYLSLTLALFKIIGVTLSLAGIAGFILSIGMAVDANVLIFERLKEELKEGKSLKTAIEEAFLRAWPSIRDGNVSTLITCALLIWFGSSFVKGFAITLAIGILISMFSAITITRVLLKFITPWFENGSGRFFKGANNKKTI